MEAALTAARRGHRVALWEKSARLGGAWIAASSPPGKGDFNNYVDFMIRQLQRSEVAVSLGKAADPHSVAAAKPDVVIVAAGALVSTPAVAGDGSIPVLNIYGDLYHSEVPAAHPAVIGGLRVCCETAQWLAAKGKRVTLIAEDAKLLRDAGMYIRRVLTEQIHDSEIEIYLRARLVWASRGKVVIERDGVRDTLNGIDAIVVPGDRRPNPDLAQQLTAMGQRAIVIGDASSPRDAFRATQEAFAAAYNLE